MFLSALMKVVFLAGLEFILTVLNDLQAVNTMGGFLVVLTTLNTTLWGMLSAIFTVTCMVDALTDTSPHFKNNRICICSTVCLCCLVLNCLILNPLYFTIIYTWMYIGMYIVNVAVVFIYLLSIFIYSLNNISIDYHFLNGFPLNQFWIVAFKICFLLLLVSKNNTFIFYFVKKLVQHRMYQKSVGNNTDNFNTVAGQNNSEHFTCFPIHVKIGTLTRYFKKYI